MNITQEMINKARDSAMSWYDNCKRPDLTERSKVLGAMMKYQMSLDAQLVMENLNIDED